MKKGGLWYYFDKDGIMEADAYRGGWYAKNASYTIDGMEYAFDKNGYMK